MNLKGTKLKIQRPSHKLPEEIQKWNIIYKTKEYPALEETI